MNTGDKTIYKGFKAKVIQAWSNLDGDDFIRLEITDPTSTLKHRHYSINCNDNVETGEL